jgi:choloylglycine hydrolase
MRTVVVLLAVLATLLLAPTDANACTAFLLKHDDDLIFGRNYDWHADAGLILVNKHNVAKTAYAADRPARWTSRYGSVTFNQYGREFPLGGMNEAGLTIATLWLEETRHRAPDSTPTLSSLQWVQYQLDNFGTIEEVIASDSLVRIVPGSGASVHYLVADATGAAATVEFIAGRPVYHTGADLPWPVLTNNACSGSIESLRGTEPFGGSGRIKTDFGSLARYARAALYLRDYDPDAVMPAEDYAFAMLGAVGSGMFTKWSIVYDIPDRIIRFRTQRNQALRRIDAEAFDYSAATPALMLDVNARGEGDVTATFTEYTFAANHSLLRNAFRDTPFLRDTPDAAIEQLARYPETTRPLKP